MDKQYVISELKRNKEVFKQLLTGTSTEIYTWKHAPDKWCMLEMLCHLVDEEIEDFRARVQHVLTSPDKEAKSIDPQGWVSERRYMEQDFDTVLSRFLDERQRSIDWLQSLDNPQWNNTYNHPKLGGLTAKMFFTNWLAHDYLHIRQIVKLRYDYLSHSYDETLSYAGTW